ncbi:MAG TPA: hypothetical protein VGZ90_13275 [Puia sp.]|jgi:hypothetical protein|nr:hypothetical protein [Puia sp.]
MPEDVATLEAPAKETAEQEQPNIAAIIAKQGVQTTKDNTVDIPDIKIKKEEPATAQKQEEPKTEAVPKETPAPEQKPISQAQPEQPKQAVQPEEANWQEVLKKQPEIEILKAIGLDEKMAGLIQKWKSGGDVTAYLKEAATDYSKMTGEQLMRHQLKSDYPELSDEDFEELYESKVTDTYKLDPNMYSEKDVKRGKILLNADTKKIRDALVEKQKQYILDSKPPEVKPDPAIAQAEAALKQSIENYQKEIKGSSIYNGITKDKKLSIEIEGQKFNWEIPDINKYEGVMFDTKKWGEAMLTEKGEWDHEQQAVLGAVATDWKGFLNSLAKFYIDIGKKQTADLIENAKLPGDTTAKPEAKSTPVAALAKSGNIVSG